MNFKYPFFLFLFLLAFFLVLEFSAKLFLNQQNESKAFLFNFSSSTNSVVDSYSNQEYNQVDPLVGWSMSPNEMKSKGFEIYYGNVIFESQDCEPTKTILISGGSTSDMTYDSLNWPIELFQLLNENTYCVRVIVSSVAGYNSGQELLKLIELQNFFQPDIHISYSGANESENPSYTSYYERQLYEHMLEDQNSLLFPNLMFYIKKHILHHTYAKVSLNEPINFDASLFWYNNMKNFNAFANQRNYKFYGILQPVLGQGGVIQEAEMDALPNYMRDYSTLYPKAIEYTKEQDYLFDFTPIFKEVNGKVFSDDCHLNGEAYQKIVAQNIFTLIEIELKP